MVRIGTPVLTAVFCLVAWAVAGFLSPIAAQSLAKPFPKEKEIEVPPALLAAILNDARGRTIIDRFLRGDKPPPEVITRRAAALIRKLGTQRSKLQPEDLLNAVDRIVHVAARSLSYTTVMRMAVAEDYRPEKGVIAWDFGRPFGRTMPGFEPILPDDKRITGTDLVAHGIENDNPLLTDGISGVRKIELDVVDGTYRIILMTQNVGDGTLSQLPFGGEIRIDGVPLIVKGKGPANWQDNAYLTQSGVRAAGGAFNRAGGFLAGDLGNDVSTLIHTQRGGAIVLEGTSRDGKLVIELRNFSNADSYLTGLIIEPLDQLSDLLLSRSAAQSLIPLDVRIALETQLLLVAAETVQGIAPAAGQAFESENVVTAN